MTDISWAVLILIGGLILWGLTRAARRRATRKLARRLRHKPPPPPQDFKIIGPDAPAD